MDLLVSPVKVRQSACCKLVGRASEWTDCRNDEDSSPVSTQRSISFEKIDIALSEIQKIALFSILFA